MTFRHTITAATLLALTAGFAFAAAHGGNPAVKARQAHMQLQGFNFGILGGMAKGDIPYDAGMAQGAADNLVALANMSQANYWPAGTDNGALGAETRALPALWENGSEIGPIIGRLREATAAMAAVAGNGQEAIGPAMGPIGAACSECHKAFRAPAS